MDKIKTAKPFGNGSHIILKKEDIGKTFSVENKELDDTADVVTDEEYDAWKEDMKSAGFDIDAEDEDT